MSDVLGLPATWALLNAGDVLTRVDTRVDPSRSPDESFFFVGLEQIEAGTGRLTIGDQQLTKGAQILSMKNAFQPGDILYGKLRPNLNKVYLATRNGICSTDIWVLRPSKQVAPEFVAYYLRSDFVRQRTAQMAVGVNLPRVSAESFDRLPFPLPTQSEQREIISFFRELEAIAHAKKAFGSSLRDACQYYFEEIFGHPAHNPRGFPVKPLSELGTLDRGISKHRPRDADHLYGGPYPFIQTGDVANAGDWITSYSSTYSEAGLAQSRLWPRGTLCITIAANIANVAILDFDACFPDSIVGFISGDEVTTEYILYCIRSFQSYFESQAPQGAQKNINLETLRPLKLPVAPMDLQRRFQSFLLMARQVFLDMRTQSSRMDDLQQEFALAGFAGELTEIWRTKHSELLAQESEARQHTGVDLAERIAVQVAEHVPLEREIQLYRPERAWLLEQLSDFQQRVRLTLLTEWKGTLIAGDLEALDDFCRLWPVESDKDRRDQIRRALQQLAALGLIAKVSVRQTQDDGEVLFVDGFRPLRDEEVNPSRDYDALKPLLRTEGNEA